MLFIYILVYVSVNHCLSTCRVSQLEEDQGFKEFLSVHQNRSQAPTWANDTVQQTAPDVGLAKAQGKKKPASDDYLNFDSDQSEDEDREEEDDEDEGW